MRLWRLIMQAFRAAAPSHGHFKACLEARKQWPEGFMRTVQWLMPHSIPPCPRSVAERVLGPWCNG